MTFTQTNMVNITKGLDLPLGGRPENRIDAAAPVSHVALLGRDYIGMKPTLLVQEGALVKLGQPLFADKKHPEILFTSPACGRVSAINRGERRVFTSLVIELEGDEEVSFPPIEERNIPGLSGEEVEKRLLESGLWTALRTRPFSKIPVPGTRPAAIFVTAIDTNPLAADPAQIIAGQHEFFLAGLQALRPLTGGNLYLCHASGADIPAAEGVTKAIFSGPHPAGLPGTHINALFPADINRMSWSLVYQDVIAIGALFLTGRILTERIVALGGPQVENPRLLRSRLGASLNNLTSNELIDAENRVVSGSVLSGHAALGDVAYLGRYHSQVSVLPEERQRKFLEWLMPGFAMHSVKPIFASSLFPGRELSFTTSTHGSLRAMVPIGAYEKVMPLDFKITWLLRSLLAGDVEMAQKLGCLELDEEDLALCSYVCPGKIDYGHHLRKMLNRIEEEGI
jgi:Na+-transporting NADH:ubiquinone oxidoreductase subunit A